MSLTGVLAVCLLVIATAAEAATIWTGPRITFAKLNSDDATLPQFQDRMTPRVWLTRGPNQGFYNIAQESTFTRATSPADTEWAFGTTADLPNLKFTTWVNYHGGCGPCQVGKDSVVHLISDDIYIDIKILTWPAATGNYTYERSTPLSDLSTTYAIEYYHKDFNHYFMTADPLEAAGLDAMKVPGGWSRTGQSFVVDTAPGASLVPVCRFFSAAFAPKSSHFYTADPDECAQVKTNSSWVYEGNAFFADQSAADNCPSGTAPLYRTYNNGQGGAPNHRYTTCTNIRDRMLQNGWVSEGVGMCVVSNNFGCKVDLSFGTTPAAPTGLSVTSGNANVTISFKPPPIPDGSLPITSYTARCTSAGVVRTATGGASPLTVRGLANGISVACTVVATNDLGDSPASLAVLATPAAFNSTRSYNPLAIPPLLAPTVVDGTSFYDLTLAPSSRQFISGGPATNTYGYNGMSFWGPTLLMKKGDLVQLRVHNSLPEETTTHWHGVLLTGASDGGPHAIIEPGDTWMTQPFVVKNNASTYWYHPHRHMTTQKQLTLGAGGFIIIKDDEEAALALPRTYGVDDIPLTLTSRRFATIDGVDNQLQYVDTAYGDAMLTNGTMNAQFTFPKQMVRLRLLNSEIEREYNIGFNDGRVFYVIGNDGGLLGAPTPVTQLIMAPGERYEILVDMTRDVVGNSINLEAHNGPDGGLEPRFRGLRERDYGRNGQCAQLPDVHIAAHQRGRGDGGRHHYASGDVGGECRSGRSDTGERKPITPARDQRRRPCRPVHLQQPKLRYGQDRSGGDAGRHGILDSRGRRCDEPFFPYPRRSVPGRGAKWRSDQSEPLGTGLEGHDLSSGPGARHLHRALRRDRG